MKEADLKRWREEVLARAVSRRPIREGQARSGGEALNDIYTSLDKQDESRIGLPGSYPFTRGVQPTMYRASYWTMRQYAGFGTAAESNARYRYLLEQGTTGLSMAFDLPTQMGFDSDDAMALGEVGKVGVAIDTLDDMRTLLKGIPLNKVSSSMTINATASTLLSFYVAVAEERGVPASALNGTVQNDILKEYIARGTYIYPPRASMRIITDMFSWCQRNTPRWNTISISGYHIREAGSTAAQELGFTLANGLAYIDAAVANGQHVDEFAPRLSFFFNAHNNLLEEVAKFRAARRMWATLLKERYGSVSEKAMRMRFHTQTAGSTLAAQQIDNNVVRVTLQALAAVFGGTQSLHTNGRDEALALPTESSARLALRTQQIIAYESGVADFVDPLGGSYVVEALTDELETQALQLIGEVDGLGGMVTAIEQGFPQREIQNAAYRSQLELDRGEQVFVGVNRFQGETEAEPSILTVDAALEDAQVARVQAYRQAVDRDKVASALAKLEDDATGVGNLMESIMGSVTAGCTLGEVSHTLRGVFGVHREKMVI